MPVDVGPLLELQNHDSAVDRARARLAGLPEQRELDRLMGELRRGETALAQAAEQASEGRRNQDRLEGQLNTIEAKASSVADRLYGRAGVVSSPKELQALQADLEMINRQKEQLEEQVIGAMELREAAAELEKRTEQAVGQLRERVAEAERQVARARAEVEAELAQAAVEGKALRSAVPQPVLELYDRMRAGREDGVAVAPLTAGICGGCQLRLSSAEYEAARHASEIVRCEACHRILVLT